MKKQTLLNIGYDLEVLSFSNRAKTTLIEILVTCEEGSESFWIEIKNYGEAFDDITPDMIEDIELLEAEQWVNETVIGYIASEAAKTCVKLSNHEFYYSFSIGTINDLQLTVMCFEKQGNYIGKLNGSWSVSGEEQSRELLNTLSNGI